MGRDRTGRMYDFVETQIRWVETGTVQKPTKRMNNKLPVVM